ncbi:MAG: hypothetical protein C0622_04095 [Desulfuromonas sp.]|nr:MAG: hypothetical protein C0622_04095 [Desulfuromonas sp.]
MQATHRAKTGVRNIQRNGVWILISDPSDLWKITAIIGGFALFGSFVLLLPGDDNPPQWFITIWTIIGVLFSGACFYGSWWLSRGNALVGRIEPQHGTVVFSPKKGARPLRLKIADCYVQISQVTTKESPVAGAGMPLGTNYPEFVGISVGTGFGPSRETQQAVVATYLPYAEVAEGLSPLLVLGPWKGIVMTDAHAALREVVMTQVRHCAGATPILIPRRAAECMALVAPYRVYDSVDQKRSA